jgi:hypothetical protein
LSATPPLPANGTHVSLAIKLRTPQSPICISQQTMKLICATFVGPGQGATAEYIEPGIYDWLEIAYVTQN